MESEADVKKPHYEHAGGYARRTPLRSERYREFNRGPAPEPLDVCQRADEGGGREKNKNKNKKNEMKIRIRMANSEDARRCDAFHIIKKIVLCAYILD